jgi:hypothetical protein
MVFLAYNPSPRLGQAFSFLQGYQSVWFILTEIPAILVLVAWLKRIPDTGPFWRWIWHNGRYFLTATLLMQFALLASREWQGLRHAFSLTDSQRFVILNLGLDVLVLYYLWRFSVVRDVFADFPPTKTTSESKHESNA